jgi:hypothetical protein
MEREQLHETPDEMRIVNPYRFAGGGGNGLLTGLFSYYKLEEASGTRDNAEGTAARDLSNQSNDRGNVAAKTGNGALWEQASGNTRHDSPAFSVVGTTKMSANFWLRFASDPTTAGYPLTLNVGNGNNIYCRIDTNGDIKLAVNFGDYSGTYNLNHATDYMITFTVDGSDSEIFVNGTSRVTKTHSGALAGGMTRIYLGLSIVADMWLDEVALWSRILSPSDVTALYASGSGLFYDDFD